MIFISAKDLQQIFPHITTYQGAWNRLKKIKQAVGKKARQPLSLKEFADWEDLPADEIQQLLKR